MTETQFAELNSRIGKSSPANLEMARTAVRLIAAKPKPVEGPLEVRMTLWGHCPSKKSQYRVSGSGRLILDADTRRCMDTLTTQALFQWTAALRPRSGPVEHPEVTTTFYVAYKRQDEDGMTATLMDCLQKSGVIVNDNIAHFNGRKIHEPCEFVELKDERVEILVRKS